MVANTPEEWRWTAAHGQRLREARIKKGLQQKEAAVALRVSDDTIRNWENGSTQPREGYLAAIAEFCGMSLAELLTLGSEPVASSPVSNPAPAATLAATTRRVHVIRWVFATVICVAGVLLAVWFWHRRNEFRQIRLTPDGIEAISRSGRRLWAAPGVEPSIAERWALVRMPGGRTLVACVLSRRGDYRPEAVSTLSFVEPNANKLQVVRTVRLPHDGWKSFPAYARRYELAYLNAVDLDSDGIDEILATYQQVPECVSYTILYEPTVDRARLISLHTGAHHFTGAWDIDGDGRKELLFLGINNGYNWMNVLAALRLVPPVGSALQHDDYPMVSPDSPVYLPRESGLLFYTLLPRGAVPNNPAAVSWNASRRLISVSLLTGRVIEVTPLGFIAGSRNARSELARAAAKRQAYAHDREARRLIHAGFAVDAIAECRKAVAVAEQSGDVILLEAMQRDLATFLIRGGHEAEGEALGNQLAARSENASEIYYDIAAAFHLAGQLRQAVSYYERGIRQGGSPEAGKSKHEFLQGQILALTELRAFAEAEQAIERFRARYVARAEDWTARYREFVRWQKGEVPDAMRIVVEWNATDLQRYWMLEFANANERPAPELLQAVDALLAEGNQPRAGLLSLRAVLLGRLGRHAEARTAAQEAMLDAVSETKNSIIVRGHMQIIAARHSELGLDRP